MLETDRDRIPATLGSARDGLLLRVGGDPDRANAARVQDAELRRGGTIR